MAVKKTKEQRAAKKLNPSLTPSAEEQRRYELATFRTARKNRYKAHTGQQK